jgi:WG containing repeat
MYKILTISLLISTQIFSQKNTNFNKFLYTTEEGQICVSFRDKGITYDTLGNEIGYRVRLGDAKRFAFPNNIYLDFDTQLKKYAFFDKQGTQLTPYDFLSVTYGERIFCVRKEVPKDPQKKYSTFTQLSFLDENLKTIAKLPESIVANSSLIFNPNKPYFSDALCLVVKYPDKYGYVDRMGKFIIPPTYDQADKFTEGLAAVRGKDSNGRQRWGFIDKAGKVVIPLRFEKQPQPFSNGLSIINEGQSYENTYGAIDKTGKLIFSQNHASFPKFNNGVTIMREVTEGGQKGNYKLVSSNGETIKEFKSNEIPDRKLNSFRNGYISIPTTYSGYLIDTQGKDHFKEEEGILTTLPFGIFYFIDLSKGLSKITHGFKDKKGKVIVVSPYEVGSGNLDED